MIAVRSSLFLLFFILALPASQAESPNNKIVAGSATFYHGSPATQIEIAPKWKFSTRNGYTVQSPEKNGFAISDSEGLFEMEMLANWWDGILAYDANRKYGGIVYVPRDQAPQDIALVIKPLAKVTAQIVSKSPDFKLKRANVAIYSAPDDKGHTMILSSSDVAVEFLLPPGRYKLQATAGTKMGRVSKFFTVPENEAEFDLGRLEIPLLAWSELSGKPAPPLEFSAIRGLPENTSWETLKGKWVLIDFWATWCGPCHREMEPIISFYNRNQHLRSKFEVIGIHASDAKDFETVDTAMQQRYAKAPGARQISFPIALDAERKISKAYGIQLLPTTILIDPNGNIASTAAGPKAFDELKARLTIIAKQEKSHIN